MSGPLNQDDIDSLLAQLGADPAPAPGDAKPSTEATGRPPTGALQPSRTGATPPPAAATPAPATPSAGATTAPGDAPTERELRATAAPAQPPTGALTGAASKGRAPVPGDPSAGRAAAAAAGKPPTTAVRSGASGRLGQDDIDKLLADLGAGGGIERMLTEVQQKAQATPTTAGFASASSGAKPAVPAAAAPAAAAPARPPTGASAAAPPPSEPPRTAATAPARRESPLSQDDIDKLLTELGAATTPVQAQPRPTAPTPAVPVQTAATSKTGAAAAPTPAAAPDPAPVAAAAPDPAPVATGAPAAATPRPPTPAAAADAAKPPTVLAATSKTAPAVGSASKATLSLSSEEIDALVAKQSGRADTNVGTEMIAQSDIDALVKQLADATGAQERPRAPAPAVADLAKHEGAIDQILAEGGPSPSATSDAVNVNKVLGIADSTAQTHAPHPLPVGAPLDLRGARWLLAAAVVVLSICATALVLTVGRLGELASELRRTRAATQVEPGDRYAEDYATAIARLGEDDPDAQARGVMLLERLRARHPAHAGEISLTLARHHRGRGDHARAVADFARAWEPGGARPPDPQLRLDYGDSLARTGNRDGALLQVYAILAAEDAWLAARSDDGIAIPAEEQSRNRLAVQRAYLMLGRLLGDEPVRLARRDAPAADPAGGHAGHAAPAAHPTGHGGGH